VHVDPVLDADKLRKHCATLIGLGKLDHEGRFPV
jgi:hypothetical protein